MHALLHNYPTEITSLLAILRAIAIVRILILRSKKLFFNFYCRRVGRESLTLVDSPTLPVLPVLGMCYYGNLVQSL